MDLTPCQNKLVLKKNLKMKTINPLCIKQTNEKDEKKEGKLYKRKIE